MKVKQYISKYGIRLAVIVVIAAVIVGVGASVRAGLAGPAEDGTGALSMPIKKAATALVGWMEAVYSRLYEYDQLVEENNSLRAENAQLREQARDYDEVLAENERLRALSDLRARHSDFVFESAKIVSWDSSNYASAFTISKGSDQGIELGDSVVTEYGALVGQVIELGGSWAMVRTLVDVNMNVGALVGDSGYAGMVVGEFTLMQQGLTRITYLASGAQVFTDDEVLTSGKGGAFPAGLFIGTVTSVMTEAGGQTTYGVVEPACDLGSLSQVFVIKDFEIVE